GFTPARNPDMWQTGLFTQMARLSHLQTTFATFTANGEVRRGLKAAGFHVQKDVGYGVKREMLYGQLHQQRPYANKFPWFAKPKHAIEKRQAIVVGAGLAGATTAYQLAELGFQVTVLEQHDTIAQEASSNLAGTLHPLITSDWNLRSQWYLKGYQTTQAWLKKWLLDDKIQGDLNGLIQLAATPTAEQRIQDSLRRVGLPEDFALWQSAPELSHHLGQAVNFGGLFFPQGGWIYPKSVIQQCLNHANIELKTSSPLSDFERQEDIWQVTTLNGQQYHAAILVFATAGLSTALNTRLNLPVRPVKGQVTHLTSESVSAPLRFPLTHGGYSLSIDATTHITGATFEAPDMTTQLSWQAQAENLKTVQEALPNWMSKPPTQLAGNIAFRPTSPDHLPIIGPVANTDFMQQNYLSQSHTHAVYRYPEQHYLPGLYVNNGHGARGLLSVFLAAELLGDLINQTPLNLPSALYYASHPARFQIRAWRSGQMAQKPTLSR
ncbi:MAG: FAD-dependent 5-carboxymethylaminomethyl-2-thiouridine(34) oxidoreductase MnmC, partial [Thiotrichales bacterium]|nr:FAD-dependent 5-carboxymethylaminomethyl-2-thiouridine(34) oxidoreductase MnmC [Thiotrichales bacterium]